MHGCCPGSQPRNPADLELESAGFDEGNKKGNGVGLMIHALDRIDRGRKQDVYAKCLPQREMELGKNQFLEMPDFAAVWGAEFHGGSSVLSCAGTVH